jgi:hypothetical protein
VATSDGRAEGGNGSIRTERFVRNLLYPVTQPQMRRWLIDRRDVGAGLIASVKARLAPRERPAFLIAGAQKAGTTYLYQELCAHPHVLPALTKEIHYFDSNYHRDLEWYLGFFPRAAKLAMGRITGEASPDYLVHPLAAPRIAKDLPDTKVIILLRDPVRRAFSQFLHERRLGYESVGSFQEALDLEPERLAGEVERVEQNPGYVSYALSHYSYRLRGLYLPQVERFYDALGPERLLVLRSEALYAKPIETTMRVQEFLGLEPWRPRRPGPNDMKSSGVIPPDVAAELREYFAPHQEALEHYLQDRSLTCEV